MKFTHHLHMTGANQTSNQTAKDDQVTWMNKYLTIQLNPISCFNVQKTRNDFARTVNCCSTSIHPLFDALISLRSSPEKPSLL